MGINPSIHSGRVDAAAAQNGAAGETDKKLAWVRDAAGDRYADLEINLLQFAAIVTDDRKGTAEMMAPLFGLPPEELDAYPHACIGTVDEIAEALQAARALGRLVHRVPGRDAMTTMAPARRQAPRHLTRPWPPTPPSTSPSQAPGGSPPSTATPSSTSPACASAKCRVPRPRQGSGGGRPDQRRALPLRGPPGRRRGRRRLHAAGAAPRARSAGDRAAGSAVLIEKPLCTTLAEADELVAAAEAGARIAYAENLVHAPIVRLALAHAAQLHGIDLDRRARPPVPPGVGGLPHGGLGRRRAVRPRRPPARGGAAPRRPCRAGRGASQPAGRRRPPRRRARRAAAPVRHRPPRPRDRQLAGRGHADLGCPGVGPRRRRAARAAAEPAAGAQRHGGPAPRHPRRACHASSRSSATCTRSSPSPWTCSRTASPSSVPPSAAASSTSCARPTPPPVETASGSTLPFTGPRDRTPHQLWRG